MKESSFIERMKSQSFENVESELSEARRKLYQLFSAHWENRDCKIFLKQMRNDFDPIFNIASALGITFASQTDGSEPPTKEKPNYFKKFYDILINILTFLSLVIAIVFAHNFTGSRAMTLTYSVKYVSAFIMRCYMILDNHKIPRVIGTLSKLYSDISSSGYRSLKVKIYFQCLVFSLLSVLLLAFSCARVLYESRTQDREYLTAFGRNITANSSINIVYVLITSYIVNYFFSVLTVILSILSCWNVHLILRSLIKCYGDCLLRNLKIDASKESTAKAFTTFRKIIFALNESDDALSCIVFFTYVTCISCFFNTLSEFFELEDVLYRQPFLIAEMLLTFLFSVSIFFTITCSAAKVSTSGERLKQRIMCASDIVLNKNLPIDDVLCFMLMVDNIKSADMSMTGWGMFTITKGFVLTTAGVMITYGVLLFQFS